MNKREFDENIRKLLSDFEDDLDPKSWDSFEKKLSFEEEMDQLIKESLDSYEEPFNEEHWELFTQEVARRQIRTTVKRTAEFIIILLLLLTTQNLIQYSSGHKNTAREKVFIAKLGNSIPQLYNTIEDVAVEKSFRLLSSTYQEDAMMEDEVLNLLMAARSQDEYLKVLQSIDRPSFSGAITSAELQIESPAYVLIKPSFAKEEVVTIDQKSIASLLIDNISPITDGLEYIVDYNAGAGKGLWISVVSGAEVNFINSPFDLNLVKSPLQSQSGSLSLGFAVSQDIGRFELQTGMIYSEKQYSPSRIRKFIPSINQRYLEARLKKLEFEQVQVPFLVHFHSPRVFGMSIYGSVGVGMSIITHSFYDIKTEVRSFTGAPTIDPASEQLNLRDLPRGVLDGGKLSDNVYASGIIGFGLEKRFASRYAINISANYQHSISRDINPIINRTQQIGFGVAFKTNLK